MGNGELGIHSGQLSALSNQLKAQSSRAAEPCWTHKHVRIGHVRIGQKSSPNGQRAEPNSFQQIC
ncbi:MAG: hypothetical protein F6J93_21655 [Oscillatoria sp. SIO1A7]|nr:hypothetical protein [Oscillatoria sp. SIO1A7]